MKRRGKGEGSIYKRADGRWVGVAHLGWTANGRERKFIYGASRKEVAQKLDEARRANETGTLVKDERVTLSQFLATWLETKRMSLRASTWKRYDGIIQLHLVPALGRAAINKLEPHHLQELYAKMLRSGLQPSSVLYLHRVMHTALQDAAKWGYVNRNVAAVVTPPRPNRKEIQTLSASGAQRLLSTAKGDRLEALYVVALTTGMRQGELLGLMWSDVDLHRSFLVVRHSLQISANGGHEIGPPKTPRSRRRIPLHRNAIEALSEHRRHQAAEISAATGSWSNQNLVFPNIVGKPITPENLLRRSFYPLLEKAGLQKMRFHDLRHSAATLLLEQGVHPKIVSEMLGHSQIGITLDLYSHVTETMLQGAVDAFDQILDPTRDGGMGLQ